MSGEGRVGIVRDRDFPTAGLLSKWPPNLGLGQAETGSLELDVGGTWVREAHVFELSSAIHPSMIAGSAWSTEDMDPCLA